MFFVLTGKRIKTGALLAALVILAVIKSVLTQAGQAAAKISALPDWLSPVLIAVSHVIGFVLLIGGVALLMIYGTTWLPKLFDTEPEERGLSKADEAKSLTKDLALTVANLERYGGKSTTLVQDAQLQTAALVELIKTLSRNAHEMAQKVVSLNQALDALETGDPVKIVKAGSQVQDEHIRSLS